MPEKTWIYFFAAILQQKVEYIICNGAFTFFCREYCVFTFLWIFNNCWSAARTYVKRFFVACFLSFFELISTNPIYLFCATIPPTPIIWNSRVYIKIHHKLKILILRSNHPEIFLEKGVLEIRSKFTGERPCRRTISIKLQCSPVNFAAYFQNTFF